MRREASGGVIELESGLDDPERRETETYNTREHE